MKKIGILSFLAFLFLVPASLFADNNDNKAINTDQVQATDTTDRVNLVDDDLNLEENSSDNWWGGYRGFYRPYWGGFGYRYPYYGYGYGYGYGWPYYYRYW